MLILSGLPWFLWKEAMKHSAWLQNRTLTHALDRKTPYEMRHGKKPYLTGIQEFDTAVYMKDLDAGKLRRSKSTHWEVCGLRLREEQVNPRSFTRTR